jgi:hypothetical protein
VQAAREVRAVLSLCAAPPREGERSVATTASLDQAAVAVTAVVARATEAAAALERIFNAAAW